MTRARALRGPLPLALVFLGCGYRFLGTPDALQALTPPATAAPAGATGFPAATSAPSPPERLKVRTVAVPLFRNETLEPGVEGPFTRALVEQVLRYGDLKLDDGGNAEGVLRGKVLQYRYLPNYFPAERATSYRIDAKIRLDLESAGGALLWTSGEVPVGETYGAAAEPLDTKVGEEQALTAAAARVMETLYLQLRGRL